MGVWEYRSKGSKGVRSKGIRSTGVQETGRLGDSRVCVRARVGRCVSACAASGGLMGALSQKRAGRF